ncbi:hypothetical protein ACGF3K_14440 [Streptomyces sp. NPDC047980]|uniref:hypothetical protein n=1 Tax=Streptomyces sp. NPDC047980 TaxID=3365494 RepID=UPI0037132750
MSHLVTHHPAPEPNPSRRLVAAGSKRGTGPLIVVLSDADRRAHDLASYVRPRRAA